MSRFNLYFRTLGYVKPYAHLVAISITLSFLIVTFEGTSLWIIGTLANTLFNPEGVDVTRPEFSLTNLNQSLKYLIYMVVDAENPVKTLTRVCTIFVIAFFGKNVFSYLQSLVLSILNLGVVRDLRDQVYSHSLKLPVTYYDRNRSGSILSAVLNDVGSMNAAMSTSFTKLVTEPIRLLTFVTLLFIINAKLMIFIFAIYPFLIYIIVRISRSVRRRSRRVYENMAGLVSILHETVNGVRAVKMFNMDTAETQKFRGENLTYSRNSFKSSRAGALTAPLTEVFGLIVAVSLLWYGGNQVLSRSGMTAEDFIRFLTLLIFSYQPLKTLGGVNNALQGGMAAAERVFKILDSPSEKLQPVRAENIPAFTQEIAFNNVRFTYPNCEDAVLRDISFTAPKGSIVAVVGPSGSGKSTILDLLPRFYDVTSGSITLDRKDIREFDLAGLRHLFGIVAQETILFNDTVFNNIGYGSHTPPTRDQVIEAAKAANAWEFIEKLPQGLESMIGEKGVLLSGGQCQRLSIARALLRNPPILILDEATSSLDTESERLVQAAINRLMENRTVLVVAHRLSTVQHADQILVIDQGRIIERGTHQQLLSGNTRYKYFYDMQFSAPAA